MSISKRSLRYLDAMSTFNNVHNIGNLERKQSSRNGNGAISH